MKVDKMVPKVYYKESRDFSYVGRIFEIGLNYMKTCADLVGADPDSDQVNPLIVDLLATSLGFESKHEYQTKELIAIASTLIDILRYKGTLESVKKVIETLSASQGIGDVIDIAIDPADKNNIALTLPPNMTDIILAEDLFDYILPVGTCVTVVRASNLTLPTEMIDNSDNIPEIVKISNETLSYIVSEKSRLVGADGQPIVPQINVNAKIYEGVEAPIGNRNPDAGIQKPSIQKPSLTYFGTVYTPKDSDDKIIYPDRKSESDQDGEE